MLAAQCHIKYKAAFQSNGTEADPLSAIHLPVQSALLQGREGQHYLVLHLGNSSGKASQLCICLGPGATEKTEGYNYTFQVTEWYHPKEGQSAFYCPREQDPEL